jgi:secreted trypsin-like serine protease
VSTTAADDPTGRVRDLVDEIATVVAGDDPAAYAGTVVALLNVAGELVDAPGEQRGRLAMHQLSRQRRRGRGAVAVPQQPDGESIWSDQRFLANFRSMVRDRQRIVGGTPTTAYPDCVAVGNGERWCCSGTLVAPNLVVTAGHCDDAGCSSRVLFGEDTDPRGAGRVVHVDEAHVHPEYVQDGASDLTALVLSESVDDVPPRDIAPREALDGASAVRLVGFGNVDVFASQGYGVKRLVDVPLASSDPRFGADPELEFVAGQPFLDRDSCTGDSGGPAYVMTDGDWLLAGATSRATSSSIRPCGDGGIYERMHAFASWLQSIPGARF